MVDNGKEEIEEASYGKEILKENKENGRHINNNYTNSNNNIYSSIIRIRFICDI